MNPVFIRKKYDSFQDEADLQKQVGPVYQNKKRIKAINEAIQNKIDIAIMDDGFQDFSIDKNLSNISFKPKKERRQSITSQHRGSIGRHESILDQLNRTAKFLENN